MRAAAYIRNGRHHRSRPLTVRLALILLGLGAVLGSTLFHLIYSENPAWWCA